MRILAVDVGAGTQDILVFDSRSTIENCLKMVLPSPTVVVGEQIRRATREGHSILLHGFTMGGGSSTRALMDHIGSGLSAFATPPAARTFDDDLELVEKMGVVIVSEDEAKRLRNTANILLGDLQLDAIRKTLELFNADTRFDGIAIAVQDHGAAPQGISDRIFRFEYLKSVVGEKRDLFAFAYSADEIPSFMTRMNSVAASVKEDVRFLVLDTGPAATIGALEDPVVAGAEDRVIINIGNGHTLAIRVVGDSIVSLFEHHTGAISAKEIERFVTKLVAGTLEQEEIFSGGGHGCLVTEWSRSLVSTPLVAVTGPRRNMLDGSTFNPYNAVPHGDMMLSGSFGLVRAFSRKVNDWREEIEMRVTVH